MTLLVLDGADNQFQKVYSETGSTSWISDAGVYGGGAFYIPFSSTSEAHSITFRWSDVTAASVNRTVFISYWMKSTATPPSTNNPLTEGWMDFSRNPEGQNGWIDMAANTGYPIARQSYTQSLGSGQFSTPSLNPISLLDTKWHHVFMLIKYSSTVGNFRLKVDNKFYANTYGDNITFDSGTGIYQTVFNNIRTSTVGGYYLDDIIIWDETDTGDNFTNFEISPSKIFTLRPSADTAQAQSIPSTGSTRFNILRQNDANATNGVITLQPGKKDLYELDNISANANVRAIVFNMAFATGNVATKANVRVLLSANNVNIAGNDYSTTSLSISNPYEYSVYPSALNSNNKFAYISLRDFGNNNIAWSQTSITSLQIGLENTGAP